MSNLKSQISKLKKPYNPKLVEGRIYKIWEKSGYFNPDRVKRGKQTSKTYTITLPPPNITGSLHMGHTLNATIQDILIRKKRMEGFKTLWLPGTDHAGIATQNVVEKELKKQGKTRHDLGREKFIKRVWEWKEQYGNIILDQLKKLGASCDWSRTAFTMDKNYADAVTEAFIHYYKKGLIYQGERVINWCPRCQTSLSDLELEYEEEKGSLWFIRYPIKKLGRPTSNWKSDFLVVATTRPETMLGDSAVAVNPRDARYKNLIGKTAILPLQNREIPIIADRRVEQEFGTGAVKITPAHDMLDAEIGKTHNLPAPKVINEYAKMTPEAGKICEGLKTTECRQKIIEELEKLGLIEKIEEHIHRVSKCYRCNKTIEPLSSKQWFVKMSGLAQVAIKEVKSKQIKFHPKRWEKIYFDWLKNIKDWCISRQIWWGHQLPVYFCQNKQEGISKSKFLISKQIQNSKSQTQNFVVAKQKPKKCPICKNCEMEQSTDVLDTWFSSALWPFATLGWPLDSARGKPKKSKDLKIFYPTQVLVTARDIINLWVARMIFSGMEFIGKKPFDDVIIHATILTRDGKRMSKSLGTGIDPLKLTEQYGADATRFALIWQAMGNQDIKWDESALVAGKKFLNKIWNASRFVLQQIGNSKFEIRSTKQIPNSKFKIQKLTNADKQILKKLDEIIKNTEKDIEKYEFGRALHNLYDFFWHHFCDVYLEVSKKQLDDPKLKENTGEILSYILITSLKLLHPFIPHITEELWDIMPIKNKKLLIIESWPK